MTPEPLGEPETYKACVGPVQTMEIESNDTKFLCALIDWLNNYPKLPEGVHTLIRLKN